MTLEGGSIVRFRELIRKEIRKQLRAVDQVELGTVLRGNVEDDDIEVQLDSMGVGIPVIWAATTPALPGQRVVVLAKMGGQQWIVVTVLNDLRNDVLGEIEVIDQSEAGTSIDIFREAYPGLRGLMVYVWGAGGAGGGATEIESSGESSFGAGGGSGAFHRAWIPESVWEGDDPANLLVGERGEGVTGAGGGQGENSRFRIAVSVLTLTSLGGRGGSTYESSTTQAAWNGTYGGSAGWGGAAISSIVRHSTRGRTGGGGWRAGGGQAASGAGGNAPFGGGSGGPSLSTIFGAQAGASGDFPGGGGSGASTNSTAHAAQPGGDGGGGRVMVEVYR